MIIDPPPLAPDDEAWLCRQDGISHILITNRDHLRESARLREALSSKVLIHEKDAHLIDLKVDGTFRDGDRLPGGLLAVHVPDGKSPGETAFFLEEGNGVLFLGDALIGKPAGRLHLMPADKYRDVGKAREGIRVLLKYQYDTVLVGDGVSVPTAGRRAVERFVEGAA